MSPHTSTCMYIFLPRLPNWVLVLTICGICWDIPELSKTRICSPSSSQLWLINFYGSSWWYLEIGSEIPSYNKLWNHKWEFLPRPKYGATFTLKHCDRFWHASLFFLTLGRIYGVKNITRSIWKYIKICCNVNVAPFFGRDKILTFDSKLVVVACPEKNFWQ